MANSFMNFSNQHRQDVRNLHPGLHVTEIAKILGGLWRSLDQDEKDQYKDEDYVGDIGLGEEEDEDEDDEVE